MQKVSANQLCPPQLGALMSQREKTIDGGARKRIAFLILIVFIFGLMSIQSILGYFEELKLLADHDPGQALIKLRRFSSILLIVNAVATTVFAFYFMSMGWRNWKSVETSAAKTEALRVSMIRTATRAKITALICIFLALLILSTNAFMWYFHRMLEKVG